MFVATTISKKMQATSVDLTSVKAVSKDQPRNGQQDQLKGEQPANFESILKENEAENSNRLKKIAKPTIPQNSGKIDTTVAIGPEKQVTDFETDFDGRVELLTENRQTNSTDSSKSAAQSAGHIVSQDRNKDMLSGQVNSMEKAIQTEFSATETQENESHRNQPGASLSDKVNKSPGSQPREFQVGASEKPMQPEPLRPDADPKIRRLAQKPDELSNAPDPLTKSSSDQEVVRNSITDVTNSSASRPVSFEHGLASSKHARTNDVKAKTQHVAPLYIKQDQTSLDIRGSNQSQRAGSFQTGVREATKIDKTPVLPEEGNVVSSSGQFQPNKAFVVEKTLNSSNGAPLSFSDTNVTQQGPAISGTQTAKDVSSYDKRVASVVNPKTPSDFQRADKSLGSPGTIVQTGTDAARFGDRIAVRQVEKPPRENLSQTALKTDGKNRFSGLGQFNEHALPETKATNKTDVSLGRNDTGNQGTQNQRTTVNPTAPLGVKNPAGTHVSMAVAPTAQTEQFQLTGADMRTPDSDSRLAKSAKGTGAVRLETGQAVAFAMQPTAQQSGPGLGFSAFNPEGGLQPQDLANITEVDAELSIKTESVVNSKSTSFSFAQAPELTRHISQQILFAVRNAAGPTTDVALNPAELGHVRISLTSTENGIVVAIQAERPETLELMRRHVDQLAQDFLDIGYGSAEFSFSSQGQASNFDGADQLQDSAGNDSAGIGMANAPTSHATPKVRLMSADRVDIRL